MRLRFAWIAALALVVSPASAEDRALAEALFDQGMALMQREDYAGACAKFNESIAASPGLGTMLWLGECYEKRGQTASAWAQFRRAAMVAADKSDPRQKVAQKRASDLEPNLARLTVVVRATSEDVAITRDGAPLDADAIGQAVPLDPGPHTIVASAPGRRIFRKTINVAPRATERVEIPELEVGEGETPETAASTLEDDLRAKQQRMVGITLGAVGVVGLGLGAIFGLRASSKLDDSNANNRCRQPGDLCTPEGLKLRDEAGSAATASTIFFGLGAAAIAAGAVVFLTAPRGNSTSPAIALTPNGAGVALTGSY